MLKRKATQIATMMAVLAAIPAAAQRREAILLEGPRRVSLAVGETASLYQILQVPDGSRASIRIEQEISGESGSLTVAPSLASVDAYEPGSSNPLAQSIRALRPGTYEVKTTATSADGNLRGQNVVRVEVTEAGIRVNHLMTFPAAVRPGDSDPVQFMLALDGKNLPPTVAVEGVGHSFWLILRDDGTGADSTAGDGIYVGESSLSARLLIPGSCLEFRGVVERERSTPARVCSTILPTKLAPSDLDNVFTTDDGEVIRNEIAVEFKENVAESLKIAAAASVGGIITGTIPAINAAQIKLIVAPRSIDDLKAKVRQLASFRIVKEADMHYVSENKAPGFDPNDPHWGVQWDKIRVRAPEAWVAARGKGQMIGIVDSGVRADHPDLNGRVVKGYDYIGNDSEPQDSRGHGTHVAGIAGAKGNNGTGVAGMAWDSKLFAVRVLNENGKGGNGTIAEGLEQSMVKQTRTINASLGSTSSIYVCSMAQKIVNAGLLLVAAAGNENTNKKRYPAACGGVISVGNLTVADQRASDSNYGDWLDISAPGSSIWSTKQFGNCANCDKDENNDGYGLLSGTSMASPIVAGTVALMWSRNPNFSRGEIVERLKATVAPLSNPNMGVGRVDSFEAVFNGSFESHLDWWTTSGLVATLSNYYSITPQHRSRMVYMKVSPNDGSTAGILQRFPFPQERSEVRMLAKVGLIAPKPTRPSTPGPRLSVVADEDGYPTTVASFSSESLGGGLTLPNGLVWSGWITVEIPIKKGNTGGIRFRLSDSGTGKTAIALIDSVSFK